MVNIKIDPILVLILILTGTLYFYNLGDYPFGPDESTYTSQAAIWGGHDQYRENFIQYSRSATNFQIQQQILAVFFKKFEINEFNARVPIAVIGIFSVVLIYFLTRELFSRKMALISALFTGINGYSLHFNKQVNIDTLMVFFMILSILFIVKWRKTKKNYYFYLFLVSVILTTMAKIIILPPLMAIVFSYLWIEKDYKNAFKMLFKPISIIIILSVVLYITYFITRIVGIDEFIKTLTYATGRGTKNLSMFYIDVVVRLLGFGLPIIAIIGIAQALRYRTEGDAISLLWLSFIMIFFTYYPIQGYNYLFPIIPPLCLLSARAIDGLLDFESVKSSRIALIILPMMIFLSIYPTINILNNPDQVVNPVAPVRFDTIRYSIIKDASLFLKQNAQPESNVAVYTFANSHVVGYYSGLRTYTINNFPGYYLPSDNYAKINWNPAPVDVIKMIEDKKMDYVIYMDEPRLSKNLTRLYEIEGVDFKQIYQKSYLLPDWYSSNNLNISIYEVVKEKTVRMENISSLDFSIIVLPSSQIYAKSRPDILKKQIEWIKENVDSLNIKFVLEPGDIVDTGNAIPQWNIVSKNLGMLDGNIPYLLVPGEHDYNGNARFRDNTNFNSYFGYTKFENYSWYGGHYPQDGNENNYGLFSTYSAGDFLVLGLDYCPNDDEIAWADSIINKYSNRKIILFTHSFLNENGERIAFGKPNSCSNNGVQGNEGDDIFNKLVSKHQNIVLVTSVHGFGVGKRSDTINYYPINQILQNYQLEMNGGNGYLRIFTFVPESHTISVKTYSPYLNQFNSSMDNEFSLPYRD